MPTTKIRTTGKSSASSVKCIRRVRILLLLLLGLVEEGFDGIVDDGHIDGRRRR